MQLTTPSCDVDVKNLSSRKLFELLSRPTEVRDKAHSDTQNPLSRTALHRVEQELLLRRHYLIEIKQLDSKQSDLKYSDI